MQTEKRINKMNHRIVIPRFLAAICGMLMAVFFILVYHAYSTSHLYLDENPLVFNLKGSELIESKIFFGNHEMCQDRPCFVSESYNDSHWRPISIPDPGVYKLEQDEPAQTNIPMSLRIKLKIPQILLDSKHTIAFAPLYITGREIQLFINGMLIYEAEGASLRESNTIITIPRQYIKDGKVLIAIKAIMEQKVNPISHRYKLYLGPKEEIEFLHRATMNFGVNYHMLAAFSKGSVFIIFALIFLYTRATPGFLFFLIYALGATLEHPIIGNNGYLSTDIQVPLYFQLKAAMMGALLQYFCKHFNRKNLSRTCYIIWGILHPVMFAISLLANSKILLMKIPTLVWISNAVYICVFLFAVESGIRYVQFLKANKVETHFLKTSKQFVAFIGLYTLLISYQTFFISYQGDELRLFLDLVFFFYIALTNARSTGLNEGKIITLEGHYAEKMRMEQELNEAALIARALLPTKTPNWPFCQIDLFHQSITESSGDWYAFEESANKQFYHLILCDITGHGVQAAIIVSTCKTVLSNMKDDVPHITETHDFLLHFARRLASTLYKQGDGHHTATFLGLTFEPATQKIYYANGGHPPPFVVESSEQGARIKQLVSRGNPLGFRPDASDLVLKEAIYTPEQTLILTTDGIPLATNLKAFKKFYTPKLTNSALNSNTSSNSSTAKDLYDKIWEEHQVRTGIKPDDDVSIIILTFDHQSKKLTETA